MTPPAIKKASKKIYPFDMTCKKKICPCFFETPLAFLATIHKIENKHLAWKVEWTPILSMKIPASAG
jgi:hypothetical protein